MRSFTSLGLLALLLRTAQSQEGHGGPGLGFCSTVRSIVTSLHEQGIATSFCSTYLHLPSATTVTTTVTPETTVTTTTDETTTIITSVPETTHLVTDTTTITPIVTVTSYTKTKTTTTTTPLTQCGSFFTPSPSPSSSSSSSSTPSPNRRRRATPSPKPAAVPAVFSPWPWGNPLSSACSCLHIPTGTVTSTHTAPTSTITTVVVHTTATTITSSITVSQTTTTTATASKTLTSTLSTSAIETQYAVGPLSIGRKVNGGHDGFRFAICQFSGPGGHSPSSGDCLLRSSHSGGDELIIQPDGSVMDIDRNGLRNTLLAVNFGYPASTTTNNEDENGDIGHTGGAISFGAVIAAFPSGISQNPHYSLLECDAANLSGTGGMCALDCFATYQGETYTTNNDCRTSTTDDQWEVLQGSALGCQAFRIFALTSSVYDLHSG